MEEAQRHSQGATGASKEGFGKRCKKAAFKVFYKIISYAHATIVGLFLTLGWVNAYDIFVPDIVPVVNSSATISHEQSRFISKFAFENTSDKSTPAKAWASFAPALQILDYVCPEASEWAKQKHAEGKLIWAEQSDGTYARWYRSSGTVCFNYDLFECTNCEIACTIAHEFRHSRQNFSKHIKSALAKILTGQPNDHIIEDDAYFYESQVRETIHGR